MSVISRVSQFLGSFAQSPSARLAGLRIAAGVQPTTHKQMYELLRALYLSNGLYDSLTSALYNLVPRQVTEPLKPLRNPTYRVVEFYVSHVWPGNLPEALPIVTDNQAIVPAIEQLWKWSNWGRQKQLASRNLAMLGDLFIKVVRTIDEQQVYFQLIDAEHVTDFTEDHRGYLTMIRVDTPVDPLPGDPGTDWTHTEVWDKAEQTRRIWRHREGDAPLDQLGRPDEITPMASMGVTFVPFVHVKFRDVGDDRGMAAVTPALDKVDEANRLATRLHQMLFRYDRPIWAVSANSLDKSNRPMPPPRLGANGTTALDTLAIDSDIMLSLPGMAKLESLVPDINFESLLHTLQDHMGELENDLPELAYYSIRQMGEPSGRAIRYLLSDAIDRLLEVRGNAEAGLVQAQEMGLTLLATTDRGLVRGTFEQGDFTHSFAKRDVIEIDAYERAQAEQTQSLAFKTWIEAGLPMSEALKRSGYTDEQIVEILDAATRVAAAATGETIPTQGR